MKALSEDRAFFLCELKNFGRQLKNIVEKLDKIVACEENIVTFAISD